jgi:hypothetical protein
MVILVPQVVQEQLALMVIPDLQVVLDSKVLLVEKLVLQEQLVIQEVLGQSALPVVLVQLAQQVLLEE